MTADVDEKVSLSSGSNIVPLGITGLPESKLTPIDILLVCFGSPKDPSSFNLLEPAKVLSET